MTIQKQLAGTIKKIFSNRKDVEIPALLGDKSGTIKADSNGNVYVTFWNGETIIVRNQSVANQRHWVIVGYRNNVLQVLRSWDVFSDASFPDVPEHDHTWGKSTNPSWIRKEQFLDGLALPGTGLTVDFYGCWFQLDNVVHVIPNQTIDLTAQIPTSDARWCNVEVDEDSVITFSTGSSKANRALLLPEDIPATAATKKLLFSVKTYVGQTSFIKEVADTDFFDARFTGMGGGPALAVDWTNITSIPATFPPDLTETDPLYPRKWLKTADPTVDEDTSIGYAKLDVWLNQASSQIFICTDDTDGAAVWLPVGSNSGAPVIFSVDGTLAVLASAAVPYLATQDLTISSWYIYCEDNGSASSTIVDVNKNGTTVFTTQANRPTLSNSDPDNWAVSGTPDITSFVEGDVISIDIDQIATGAKNLLIVGFVSSTGGGGGSFNLTLEDVGASVSISNVGKIVVGAGLLQDNGGGEAQILSSAYILLQDQKTQNTDGGTFTSGAWQKRDINTEVSDDGGFCSIASSQITLQAGTYTFRISCPAGAVLGHQAKLRNVTDATDVAFGSTMYSASTVYVTNRSEILGRMTIAASKTFEVQHKCAQTKTTNGFGEKANLGTEIYTVAEFWKVA